MEGLEYLLPPHWHKDSQGAGFYNILTNESSEINPFEKYLEARSKYFGNNTSGISNPPTPQRDTTRSGNYLSNSPNTHQNNDNLHVEFDDSVSNVSYDFQHEAPQTNNNNTSSPTTNNIISTREMELKGKWYAYKCQWNERDCFGKVSLYGLTIRYYEDNSTLIKFDGIQGEWFYSSLQGDYGPITHHDLYIGAKINIFGRHLTISSANGAAIQWSEKEYKRLMAQQQAYHNKILSVRETPCIRLKEPKAVRNITRDDKSAANVDLRKVLIDNAKLGEQLVNLGLSVPNM